MKGLLMGNEQLGPRRCQQLEIKVRDANESCRNAEHGEVLFTWAVRLVVHSQQQELCAYQL